MKSHRRTLRTPAQLCEHGLIAPEQRAALQAVTARYAVALPPVLAALIVGADRSDPIGDDMHSPVEGIVHRYPDRVLLKLTHVCAVYCRFCFRREMVGPEKPNALSAAALQAALAYIRTHPQIWEVILTGGDPLVLSARRLRAVMKDLSDIAHVKVVRIHTRVPIADPTRITSDLVRALKIKDKPTYVAVHVNHARELTPQARAACSRMADAGMPLLAQTVLLAGVNDSAGVLGELMRALVECRIKPYYLHHADLAPGTAQFRTDIASGQELTRGLRGRLSGLCQPTYVLDIPGGHGKSPIGPSYLARAGANGGEHWMVEDFNGRRHSYPPLDR